MRCDALLSCCHYSREERRENSTLIINRERSSNNKVQYRIVRVEIPEMNSLTLDAVQKRITSVSSAGHQHSSPLESV